MYYTSSSTKLFNPKEAVEISRFRELPAYMATLHSNSSGIILTDSHHVNNVRFQAHMETDHIGDVVVIAQCDIYFLMGSKVSD